MTVSIGLFNTSIYSNTLWFTGANGRAPASFNLPPGTGPAPTELNHTVLGLDGSLQEAFVTEAGAPRIY